jgi:hypothetical protein
MTELKLFTTPAEEMDLAALRAKVCDAYAKAFKQMKVAIDSAESTEDAECTCFSIVLDTLERTEAFTRAHLDKWRDK